MADEQAKRDFLRKKQSGICSHAFILEGPEGIGKMEFATWCASVLLCSSENAPCGVCSSCKKIQSGFHPDVHFYGADDKTVSIGDVRDLIHETTMTPVDGDGMVFILQDAQKMQAPAQNALLKVFEEPPAGVTFFLLTENQKALLPTIRSRGQLVKLNGETEAEILAGLRAKYPRALENELLAAAKQSGGSPGKADAYLQKNAVKERETAVEWLHTVLDGDQYQIMTVIASPKYKRENLTSLLDTFLRMLTDIVRTKTGMEPFVLSDEDAKNYGNRVTRKRLMQMCDAVVTCRESVENNGNLTADVTRLAVSLGNAI